MSLTTLTRRTAGTMRAHRLWPHEPVLDARLAVPCRSRRYALLGTAFDYLLRFRAAALNPAAVARPWVARQGLPYLKTLQVPAETRRAIKTAVSQTEDDVLAVTGAGVSAAGRVLLRLARRALVLAQLDCVYREGRLPAEWESPEDVDADELAALWAVVPPALDQLLAAEPTHLNPVFGRASDVVGGADADLLCRTTLLDIKTVRDARVAGSYQDQLLGYYLLAERHREADPSFPLIENVGIYFARHGCLTVWPAAWADLGRARREFWAGVAAGFHQPPNVPW